MTPNEINERTDEPTGAGSSVAPTGCLTCRGLGWVDVDGFTSAPSGRRCPDCEPAGGAA